MPGGSAPEDSRPLPIATSIEMERYWLSLGIFASRYAEVEFEINKLVRHYYKIDQATANLLFSGPLRVDASFNHLQRLIDVDRVPVADENEISELRGQLGIITRLRNDI